MFCFFKIRFAIFTDEKEGIAGELFSTQFEDVMA
jgi:hypothetical protein